MGYWRSVRREDGECRKVKVKVGGESGRQREFVLCTACMVLGGCSWACFFQSGASWRETSWRDGWREEKVKERERKRGLLVDRPDHRKTTDRPGFLV